MGATAKSSSSSSSSSSHHHPSSPSGAAASAKECEQCGNPSAMDVGTNAKALANCRKVVPTGCQVCDYVVFRKSLRPCVNCERPQCEYFCEWCGNGYHVKCARQRNENVSAPNGFCCRRCESEQGDSEEQDDDDDDSDNDGGERRANDANATCGECELPFNSTGGDSGEDSGFQVNQAVLVENDDVLYNAVITDVDAKNERIKIHFLRWSKSFDNWYAMDDERINESLACDCCNHWFHIGCLPPIKSSGRFKDTTYVCPTCLEDAKAFYGGTTRAAKSSKTATSGSKRKASMSEDAATTASSSSSSKKRSTAASRQQSSGARIHDSDDEGEIESEKPSKSASASATQREKDREASASESAAAAKKKRKRSNSADSNSSQQEKKGHSSPVKKAKEEPKSSTSTAKSTKGSSRKRGRSVSDDEREGTTEEPQSSPEHNASEETAGTANGESESVERVVSPAPATPSSSKRESESPSASCVEPTSDVPQPEKSVVRRKVSGHSMSSLLNSPSSPVRERMSPSPLLAPASVERIRTPQLAPSSSKPPRSDSVVKIESDELCLPPPSKKSSSRSTASSSSWSSSSKASKANASSSQSRGSLSAFDILREVASQSMTHELEVEVKPKPAPKSNSRSQKGKSSAKAKKEAEATKAAAAAAAAASQGGKQSPHLGPVANGIPTNAYVDLHFATRKEMYLRICQLEEERHLERETAQLLRSLICPTSDRFHDLKFVYMVNKDNSPAQLTKRLLELVPITAGGTAPLIPMLPTLTLPPPLPRPALSGCTITSCPPSAAPSPIRLSTPPPLFPVRELSTPLRPASTEPVLEPQVEPEPKPMIVSTAQDGGSATGESTALPSADVACKPPHLLLAAPSVVSVSVAATAAAAVAAAVAAPPSSLSTPSITSTN
ncbi:hypothetical protein PINS_up011265 [Pythium insidiosum]|nr:hypothetical protein PINS_up011265 [Pythium insidiosum]